MNARTQRKGAFTLIELLIVITIIGILAVALIPRLTGGPARARDAQRKGDLQQVATALEFYAQDNGGLYPDSSGAWTCVSDLSLSSYLTTIPKDPSNPAGATVPGACTNGYSYRSLNSRTGYLLLADLENNEDRAASGIYLEDSVTGATISTSTTAATLFSGTAGNFTPCTNMTTCSTGQDVDYLIGR